MKDKEEIIRQVSERVTGLMKGHDSGHGWSHIERVRRMALTICRQEERGDPFTVELAALLHDVGDHKFAMYDAPSEIEKLLVSLEVCRETTEKVITINQNISFSKGRKASAEEIELQIVQDADRLDAMGAIGIARAFNYGGWAGNEIFDPEIPLPASPRRNRPGERSFSTIHHFYDKLLQLKDMMNTRSGRVMAEERHAFMLSFLSRFVREWYQEG